MALQLFKKRRKYHRKNHKKGFNERLFDLMGNHIGEQNGIKAAQLFLKFYGNSPISMNKYEAIFMWQKLQQAMNHLRKKTNMFIVFKNGVYFVVTNHDEASQYRKRLQTTVKQTSALLERLDEVIENECYKDLRYTDSVDDSSDTIGLTEGDDDEGQEKD